MKDICIYSSDGRADLTQADEIKSFLKDILYNFTLKRRRQSPNILKDVCLAGRGNGEKRKEGTPHFESSRCFTHVPSGLNPGRRDSSPSSFGTFACDF